MRRRILSLFLLLAVGNLGVLAAGLWLGGRRAPEALNALTTSGLAAGFGIVLVTALVWLLCDDRLARPIERIAAALRTRTHGKTDTPATMGDTGFLGDLGPAAAAICERIATIQTETDARLSDATRALTEENARLAAILSDIPVAIMVVDARNRIALYDRQCVHALGRVATLGLGRSIFEYLDRAPLERALHDLASAGAHHVDATLPTADGKGSVRARLWPSAQSRGFLLVMEVDEVVTAERPLVFDFGLLDRDNAEGEVHDTPLSALTFVVFDTETTGLDPARDEIVQIGAVRAVNGRLVEGEVFDMLVNPGRPIPPASSRVHGITDEMVAGAPTVGPAAGRFHDFARHAVLVAHNAPFDLAFLERARRASGVTFDNPVLDTVLLSAAIFGTGETHTLDAIAERLGVGIDGTARHTALGDARATAEVLIRMLPVLAAKGIHTFGDTVNAMRQHERLLPDMNG